LDFLWLTHSSAAALSYMSTSGIPRRSERRTTESHSPINNVFTMVSACQKALTVSVPGPLSGYELHVICNSGTTTDKDSVHNKTHITWPIELMTTMCTGPHQGIVFPQASSRVEQVQHQNRWKVSVPQSSINSDCSHR